MPNDDAKNKMKEAIDAVRTAAKKVLAENGRILDSVPLDPAVRVGKDWDDAVSDVDAMDKTFGEEEVLQKPSILNMLKSQYQRADAEVRVLRVGPTGRFIDVTDEVKGGNLNPEDFVGFQNGNAGQLYPISRDPRSREEAMNLLREIIPSLKKAGINPAGGKSEAERRMEAILDESGKTLEHWKE